jgi:tetratricopeptide (TPR) repeat protein
MSRFCFVCCLVALGTCALAGCKDKPKAEAKGEVSKIARAEAANLSSEADFALQMKDYPRAEKALSRAVELDPQVLVYWFNLGISRRKSGNVDGARTAYQKALRICEDQGSKNPKDGNIILARVRVLVLMNKADEARKFLEKARNDLPNDREIQSFWSSKAIDQMVADPQLKPFIL